MREYNIREYKDWKELLVGAAVSTALVYGLIQAGMNDKKPVGGLEKKIETPQRIEQILRHPIFYQRGLP